MQNNQSSRRGRRTSNVGKNRTLKKDKERTSKLSGRSRFSEGSSSERRKKLGDSERIERTVGTDENRGGRSSGINVISLNKQKRGSKAIEKRHSKTDGSIQKLGEIGSNQLQEFDSKLRRNDIKRGRNSKAVEARNRRALVGIRLQSPSGSTKPPKNLLLRIVEGAVSPKKPNINTDERTPKIRERDKPSPGSLKTKGRGRRSRRRSSTKARSETKILHGETKKVPTIHTKTTLDTKGFKNASNSINRPPESSKPLFSPQEGGNSFRLGNSPKQRI